MVSKKFPNYITLSYLLFHCPQHKQWGWIIEFILFQINSAADTQIHMKFLQIHCSQCFQIPGRTAVGTDRKLALKFLALTHHIVTKHIVGMVFRQILYI